MSCFIFKNFLMEIGLEILQLLQDGINSRIYLIYCLVAGDCANENGGAGNDAAGMSGDNGDGADNVAGASGSGGADSNVFDPNYIDLDSLHITAIQTRDTASVYLKQSDDNTIRFVPFRKPRDSYCASREYNFETDCVNVHNVRSMSFENNELSFIMAGSYPRLIEVTENTEIILNDRIFEVETYFDETTQLETNRLAEVLAGDMYQNGESFCSENIQIEKLENNNDKLIIDGACYGLLYLPANTVFFQEKSFQLLASQWSSIVIDSNVYTPEMIVAANDFASIIFRSSLTAWSLKLAITHESYVEFRKIREASHLSLVTREGAQIYIPQMMDVETAYIAARNR